MAGVQKNSEAFRKSLQSKNYFTPDNVYDLNSDIVTSTLNTLQAAGFDLRSNPILNHVERIVDNTTLVKVGYERLLVEFGRRFANQVVSDYKVNVNALFDKNPDTKLLSKNTDFHITPRTKKEGTFNQVLDYIKDHVGKIDESIKETFAGEHSAKFYYDNLGQGQKQQLNTLIGYNYYGNWAVTNVFKPEGVDLRTNTFTDNRTKPDKGQGMSYISGVFDIANQPDQFAENKYTNDLNGTAPAGFASTITSGAMINTALDVYEFGRTSPVKDSTTDPNEYRDTSTELVWGDQATFPANAKRGLLYFTNNILKTRTDVAAVMNQNNKSYQSNGTLIYKGTPCRSFTVKDQYDEFSKAIRFTGNGKENSVLKDSVFAHQYPRINDTDEDKKRYMLSLENLAWTNEDFITYNIPECERGPFGGRIMWFPFYGVDFSESSKVSNDSTSFIGRIEPIYSYAGMERVASLSFKLIMDYPSTIKDFKGSEAAYFANCDGMANGQTSKVITNKTTAGDNLTKIKDQDTSSTNKPNNKPSFNDLEYYFENDVFTVDLGYETVESTVPPISYGLNGTFIDDTNAIAMIFASKNSNNFELRIDGYASQLATDDYNVRLGYKRAYNLMNYIQTITNTIADSEDTKLNLEADKNFTSDSFIEKTTKDINNTKVVFKDKNRNIIINLYSVGESEATAIGSVAQTKDLKEVKEDRKAIFSSVGPLKINDNVEDTIILQPTSTDIQNNIDNNSLIDTVGVDTQTNDCTPFLEYNSDTKFPLDFNKMDYFRPAYHSQTPEDFHKRLTFLNQITRPGATIENSTSQGKNSIFGKSPVCNLRLGDFIHTKIIINGVSISYPNIWDLNPEGMGVQPMIAEVTIDFIITGGQSLASPIDRLQRAIDFNFYSNSTFYGKNYYGNNDKQVGPYYQERDQIQLNKDRK